jgi:hypothetical protein
MSPVNSEAGSHGFTNMARGAPVCPAHASIREGAEHDLHRKSYEIGVRFLTCVRIFRRLIFGLPLTTLAVNDRFRAFREEPDPHGRPQLNSAQKTQR